MVEQLTFTVTNISCHAWNKDRTQLALCPSNNEVHIYKRIDKSWQLTDVLNQHELTVTDIDWAPNTNRIVTSSADRNAYVWSQGDDGKWKPTLVLLRTNRAATCVKWSPFENKFAVGSGARLISVGYFDKVNDWWVSKHIKKPILSTVTALDWHPNNMLLVCGSTDYRVRIFSAFIKYVESPPNDNSPWCSGNSSLSLGTLLAEFRNSSYGGGWVHSVSFCGDGNRVCWVGHDSSLSVADATRGKAVTKCRTENLPYKCCLWVSPNSLVVAGFNCCPLLYSVDANGQISFVSKLDTTQKKEAAGLSAMHKFQSLDRQAVVVNETALATLHQNAITCLLVHTGTKGNVTKFSTSGQDDQIIIWDLQKLETSMQNLKLN